MCCFFVVRKEEKIIKVDNDKYKESITTHPILTIRKRFEDSQKLLYSEFVQKYVSFAFKTEDDEMFMLVKMNRETIEIEDELMDKKISVALSMLDRTKCGDVIDENQIIIKINYDNMMNIDEFMASKITDYI